ncbi:MAG: ATP-binding cassette domain-containing protein [Acidaminococcus sp.]|jgi:peptide/nickel transport system ATP-binding protein|nr:ATP-binding cassette domain-containing protein [Acidaminococcus sp.]MCI2100161.1 ATP-binding cassette domain-containing protein [Acidaminococcus sp.]MCI2114480.1 ATP-binding cassette domain-containing protein [Acidaminococcus sp.]MCI2116415.1 ATP-binding cassette domain-containing protein [Acidaminococcus sp.]
MENNEPILQLHNVTIEAGGRPLVKEISFSVHKEEIFVIVGASGSGKTTILKAAAGILSRGVTQTGGTISFCGQVLRDADKIKLWQSHAVQYVFQDALSSFCLVYSIRQQLWDAVGKDGKLSRQEFNELTDERASLLDLSPDALNLYPQELSGGMVQRAQLLFSMLRPPVLAFADEPTSAVDSVTQKKMADALLRVRKYHKMSLVLVTHDIRLARYMADTLMVLKDGVIQEIGPAAQVIASPKSSYTQMLLERCGIGEKEETSYVS